MKTYTNDRINRILEVTMKEMLPEQDMEYFDDCLIIQQALKENGYPDASVKAAYDLWTIYSDNFGILWIKLPRTKKEIFLSIDCYI